MVRDPYNLSGLFVHIVVIDLKENPKLDV